MPNFNSFVYDMVAFFRPEIICGFCRASFRPSLEYKRTAAPFGFDWIRNGDASIFVELDKPYKENVGDYYNVQDLPQYLKKDGSGFVVNRRMYNMLCKSYLPGNLHLFPSENGRRKRYHVPVLSIYPYDNNPVNIATISLVVEIKREIRDIRLDYDTELFDIEGMDGLELDVGTQFCQLSVKCLKEFAENKYIRLRATDYRGKTMNAGMLRVSPNAKSFRKSLDILIVNVKHLSGNTADAEVLSGDGENAKLDIHVILRHALVKPVFETVELDLQHDIEITTRMRTVEGNKFILACKKQLNNKGKPVGVSNFQDLVEYMGEKLEQLGNTQPFDVIVFCIGCGIMEELDGQPNMLGGYALGKYAILKDGYRECIPPHEVFHTMGLGHSFSNYMIDNQPSPYVYRKCTTDNIMDYTLIHRNTLWEWQWKLIRLKCKPEI